MTNRKYRTRLLAVVVADLLKAFPVVIVSGMRQTGKTTMLRQDPLFSTRRNITLDDFSSLAAAQRDPESLVGGPGPLTIDEVQRVPELFIAIKATVDRDRRPGRFLLSGSANLALAFRTAETLAGRAVTLELTGLTRRELHGGLGHRPVLVELLAGKSPADIPWTGVAVHAAEVAAGGLPEVTLGHPQKDRWFEGFVATYLERDLRAYAQVGDLIAFRTLMKMAALRTGNILNETELARDARMPLATAHRYLGLMEAGHILRRLQPFLRNRTTRLVKSPKLFCSDSGLAAVLAGAAGFAESPDDPLRGALLETYVLQNLLGNVAGESPAITPCYWNASGRYEVDFIFEQRRRAVAIEVKWASRWNEHDLAGLRTWQETTPGGGLALLACQTRAAAQLGKNLWAVPLGDLLR